LLAMCWLHQQTRLSKTCNHSVPLHLTSTAKYWYFKCM
jgi:hypothetical protein